MNRTITAIGAALLLAGCAVQPATVNAPGAATVQPAASTKAAAKPAAAAAAAANGDNGWTLVGVPKLSMALGLITAHSRVRNDSDETTTTISITYGADGDNPIVLSGAANNVAKGKTVTVDLLSGDKAASLPKGKPEFRVTASF